MQAKEWYQTEIRRSILSFSNICYVIYIIEYILWSNTVWNTLRLDSYGRDGTVLGVHSCYID